MVKWGVSEELVPPSVHQGLATVSGLRKGRTAAPNHKPIMPVSDAHIRAVIGNLTQIVADMVRLQRLTGARPGEITAVRPMDVDQSSTVWVYRPDSHKTEHHERDRVIFLGPKAQTILEKYLRREADAFCFSPRESEELRRAEASKRRKTPLKYGNRRRSAHPDAKRRPSDRYTTDSYRRAIQRACEKAGIEKWSPNQIRHSTGTEVRRTHGLEAAQTVLGHASADVTQIYAERDMGLAASVALEFGEVICRRMISAIDELASSAIVCCSHRWRRGVSAVAHSSSSKRRRIARSPFRLTVAACSLRCCSASASS